METGGEENPTETIDELRQRLNHMKRAMAERQSSGLDINEGRRISRRPTGVIDGSFLSVVFAVALIVIMTVSFYAFYNLYNAVLKRFPSKHTEL
ncbi:hypothetical protein QE152_g4685 [Popillia japonica]|uniref:Uncharacterized protein n=1 Tax=Popillia japonica TaxID=7064 RepID=A0AAW1MZK5_POPJA